MVFVRRPQVTFQDPESARRACVDPTPIIDGRRANCNLASLGRPQPSLPLGHLRSPTPYLGNVPATLGAYVGSFGYQQPVSYGYQQGYLYPQYGYATYGQDNVYPQGVYNPYVGQAGQQYLHLHGVPGSVNTAMYPYSQLSQTIPGGHGYTTVQGYGHQIVQFSGPHVNAITNSPVPTIQSPYTTGMAAPVPATSQYIVPAHSPRFIQASCSDQTAG